MGKFNDWKDQANMVHHYQYCLTDVERNAMIGVVERHVMERLVDMAAHDLYPVVEKIVNTKEFRDRFIVMLLGHIMDRLSYAKIGNPPIRP